MNTSVSFKHYIITRYNIELEFLRQYNPDLSALRYNPKWLEKRLELFMCYCAPSVLNQTSKSFRWLIIIDGTTPLKYEQALSSAVGQFNGMATVLRSGADFASVVRPVLLRECVMATHIITTRLDSDDALHKDYVARVQYHFGGQDYMFIEFPRGYSLLIPQKEVLEMNFIGNQFPSLVEKWNESATSVYCGNHRTLRQKGSFLVIPDAIGWLQIVHGGNLRNTHWGRTMKTSDEAHIRPILCDFGINL